MTKKYFGTDGIRGRVNQGNINGNMFFKFGLAAGTYFKNQKKSKQISQLTKEKIEYSAAAMPPFFYYNSKKATCEEILLEGLPLGGLKNESYTKQSLEMSKGDTIMVVSDGLPEARQHGETQQQLSPFRRIPLRRQ